MRDSHLLLDGAQCGCHGPSEGLDALRRELRACGESVPHERRYIFEDHPVGEMQSALLLQVEGKMRHLRTCGDSVGALSGEVSVMSIRRELERLEAEDSSAQRRTRDAKQFAASLQLLDAEHEGAVNVIESAQLIAFRAICKPFSDDLALVSAKEKARHYSERLDCRLEAHETGEALWFYNESHREIFERAHAKVVAEFEEQQNILSNQDERRAMQAAAIDRIFKQDTAYFEAESAQVRYELTASAEELYLDDDPSYQLGGG